MTMYKVCYRLSERQSDDIVYIEAFFYERPVGRDQCISVFENRQNNTNVHIMVLSVDEMEDE